MTDTDSREWCPVLLRRTQPGECAGCPNRARAEPAADDPSGRPADGDRD
ncbi:hypothetical protein ACBI99_09005 [Nonomuraea sp. ATR24]|nr:hypothetical protein [Nonomuraea ceibae]